MEKQIEEMFAAGATVFLHVLPEETYRSAYVSVEVELKHEGDEIKIRVKGEHTAAEALDEAYTRYRRICHKLPEFAPLMIEG